MNLGIVIGAARLHFPTHSGTPQPDADYRARVFVDVGELEGSVHDAKLK